MVIVVVALAGLSAAACSDNPETGHAGSASSSSTSSASSASPAPTAPWAAGQCVDSAAQAPTTDAFGNPDEPSVDFEAVPCSARTAAARITKTVSGEKTAALAACPKQTDGVVEGPSTWACVRNLLAPHPGDPGVGGGILRVGDCIYVDDTAASASPEERPCYDRYGPGKIRAFVKSKSQCRDRNGDLADYNSTRRSYSTLRVICHGDGANVSEPGAQFDDGTCIDKPAIVHGALGDMIFGGLHEISCRSRSAWAKVVDTVSEQSCPARATREVSDNDHYPGRICLRLL
jgi:hypothetical protein